MKLRGLTCDYEVVVMTDRGVIHNFLAMKTVKDDWIPITVSGGFLASLRNGKAIGGEGVCKDVHKVTSRLRNRCHKEVYTIVVGEIICHTRNPVVREVGDSINK